MTDTYNKTTDTYNGTYTVTGSIISFSEYRPNYNYTAQFVGMFNSENNTIYTEFGGSRVFATTLRRY
jgi:hypothetical protein